MTSLKQARREAAGWAAAAALLLGFTTHGALTPSPPWVVGLTAASTLLSVLSCLAALLDAAVCALREDEE